MFGGGSWYLHTGAAGEFVCLPRDPDFIKKFTSSYAFLYLNIIQMSLDMLVAMTFLAAFVGAQYSPAL